MEAKYNSVNFTSSIKDTFPFIESTIMILDNKLQWWKKKYEELELAIANETMALVKEPIDVKPRFVIYNGTDDSVEAVKISKPAIEFTFIEGTSDIPKKIQTSMNKNWEGHRILTEDNKLYVLFE